MIGKLVKLMLVGLVVFCTSCNSTKKVVYLQDVIPLKQQEIAQQFEMHIHVDDLLAIMVNSKDPELALPFNMPVVTYQIGAQTTAQQRILGYLVDTNGNIDFPILGKLHVEGLKVSEVTNLIRERIIAGNYIKDPIVSLEFLNFKYTVLGAVANNGTFTVDGDRITLIDAIARAGDLNAKARIDRVAVIREIGGERKMFMHDLRSMDIFDSPCYYLQQNDIVYVEPKYRKKDNEDRGWQIGTTLLSVVTAVCSILWAIK